MKPKRIVALCLMTLSLIALSAGLACAGGMTRHIYNHSGCDLEFRALPRQGSIHFNGVSNHGRVPANAEGHYGVSDPARGFIRIANSKESIQLSYRHNGGWVSPGVRLQLSSLHGTQFNLCIKSCHTIRFYLNNPANGDLSVYSMDKKSCD